MDRFRSNTRMWPDVPLGARLEKSVSSPVLTYAAWEMYHFSNQSVGVVSIYRRRMDSRAPGFAADGSVDGAAADILFWVPGAAVLQMPLCAVLLVVALVSWTFYSEPLPASRNLLILLRRV